MVAPAILATVNVGRMLQLAAGAKPKGPNVEVKIVVELLDQAYY
jgi:hypothetical protein